MCFIEQMAFQFLNFCTVAQEKKREKNGLESQAVFLTSLTEAAPRMKGMCEIAFPSISASMLRTVRSMRRMDHAAPSDVRRQEKRMVVQCVLEYIYGYYMI